MVPYKAESLLVWYISEVGSRSTVITQSRLFLLLHRWFLRLLGRCFNVTSEERDPVLLDLGQYWIPSLASTIQAVKAATAGSQATSSMQQLPGSRHQNDVIQAVNDRLQEALKYGMTGLLQQRNIKAFIAVAASALMSGQNVNGVTAADGINLYSIVAHPLQTRSQLWRNDLNLKEETQKLTRGYFDAPGTIWMICLYAPGLSCQHCTYKKASQAYEHGFSHEVSKIKLQLLRLFVPCFALV